METLCHYGKYYDTMEKKLWYSIENYGTLIYYGKKTMVLWKKLWYYSKNYGTLIYYGKNYGTMEKTMVL